MSAAFVVVLLLVLVISVGLYLLVERETSDPTIVDRSEAERIARERGGRPEAQPPRGDDSGGGADRWGTDGRDGDDRWGTDDRDDDRWGEASRRDRRR